MLKKETIVVLTFFVLSMIRLKSPLVLDKIAFSKQANPNPKWAKSGALIGADLLMRCNCGSGFVFLSFLHHR